MNMFSKVFGTRSQREVKRIMPLVKKNRGSASRNAEINRRRTSW